MEYTTVFDASQEPFRNVGFVAFTLIFVAVTAALVFFPRVAERWGMAVPPDKATLARFALLLSVVTAGISTTVIVRDNLSAHRQLASGACEIVEGPVRQFRRMPRTGERFEVGGRKFEYSDYEISSGFNNTASLGGPIREGLPVRICQSDGRILRLEVASGLRGPTSR